MPKDLPISATLSEASRLFNELGVSAKGTGPRAGGDNRDPLFHEYMVAKHLESVAKKRAEASLDRLEDSIDSSITTAPDELGMTTIDQTRRYILTCEVKRGAVYIDPEELISKLALAGVDKTILDNAVAKATKRRNPSRSYRVIANG